MNSQGQLVAALRRKISRWEGGEAAAGSLVSSGSSAFDAVLPQGGFVRGTLVEWFALRRGAGAGMLAMMAAREACKSGGLLVVIDRRQDFFPPAAAALGVPLGQVVVVHPRDDPQEQWAIHQALQCRSVATVWASIQRMDAAAFRRLQLAAEVGSTLGLFLRPLVARSQPTWAALQLHVSPTRSAAGRAVAVTIARCRGATAGNTVMLHIDEATGTAQLGDCGKAKPPFEPEACAKPSPVADASDFDLEDTTDDTHPLHLSSTLAHPAILHPPSQAS